MRTLRAHWGLAGWALWLSGLVAGCGDDHGTAATAEVEAEVEVESEVEVEVESEVEVEAEVEVEVEVESEVEVEVEVESESEVEDETEVETIFESETELTAPCGNGVVDPGELCDTAIPAGSDGHCPDACGTPDVCHTAAMTGTACTLACLVAPVPDTDGDGCCAPGVATADDADCRAIYPVGAPIRVCDTLSDDPNVRPAPPTLAAGGGQFVVACVPRSHVAAEDTPVLIDYVAADGTRGPSVTLAIAITNYDYAGDLRVLYAVDRFYAAFEVDPSSSVHLYTSGTRVMAFDTDGVYVDGWPIVYSHMDTRAIAYDGDSLRMMVWNASNGSAAWDLLASGEQTKLPMPSLTGVANQPPHRVDLEVQFDATAFWRFAADAWGVYVSRTDAAGALITPPVAYPAANFADKFRAVVALSTDAHTYLGYYDLGDGPVLRELGSDGAELASASLPRAESGWPSTLALHVHDGALFAIHGVPENHGLAVSVFDQGLVSTPHRDGPFIADGAFPEVARDDLTGTYAVVYRTSAGAIYLQRFTHTAPLPN